MLVLSRALVFSSAVAAAAATGRPARSLQEFDFFQHFCQEEGASFLQCFTALDDPDACGDCHLNFVGKGYGDPLLVLKSACQEKCGSPDATDQFGFPVASGCNQLGMEAVDCINDKIWGYHCRRQFNDLNNCEEGDCTPESSAFEECLLGGVKVLRGQNLAECEGDAEKFNSCLDSKYTAPASGREACKECHSDVGFGFRNGSCSCAYCDDEGRDVSSCIKDSVNCPDLVRKDIECLEEGSLCFGDPCLADYDWSNTPSYTAPSWNTTDWNSKYNFSDIRDQFKEAADVDWEALAKAAADAEKENSGSGGTGSWAVSFISSLLLATLWK